MTNEQAVQAVLAWVTATLPALEGSYDYSPPGKTQALPDVIADLVHEGIVRTDEDFTVLTRVQQIEALRVFTVGVSIMAEAGETDVTAHAATVQLRGFAQALLDAVLADHTLGGRVPFAAPFMSFDYAPPFVEYEDGTRGREIRAEVKVAEPLHRVD